VKKVVVKILQGRVVTPTTLGELTIYPPVANFLQCICAKNYKNWMTVGNVLPFGARGFRNYAPPCSCKLRHCWPDAMAMPSMDLITLHTSAIINRLTMALFIQQLSKKSQ